MNPSESRKAVSITEAILSRELLVLREVYRAGLEGVREVELYDLRVAELVAAARYKFLLSMAKGKRGWANSSAWHDNDEPLQRAEIELAEAKDATGFARLHELGDTLNFLAFDWAINGAQR